MAYLRLTASTDDDLAFERIVNVPKRGVGPSALQQINGFARAEGISLCEAPLRLAETDALKPKLRATLQNLMQGFARWRGLLENLPHAEVAQIILDESGYTGMWQADKSPEAPGRLDNLKELISAMATFDTLEAFLEHVSLVLEVTEEKGVPQVSLMTLHGAKGLEFPYVFLPGWEEDIFPSRLTLTENGTRGLEEERRLAYVGLTRARRRAWISHVANRHVYGSWVNALPSRFLSELPDKHVQRVSTLRGQAQTAAPSGWERERREKTPNLFRQLSATGQTAKTDRHSRASGSPVFSSPLIEGKVREVTAPQSRAATSPAGFKVGERVAHQTFGNGTIRRIDGTKLEVAFDKAGIKKVMEGFLSRQS